MKRPKKEYHLDIFVKLTHTMKPTLALTGRYAAWQSVEAYLCFA
jgi:hypothetical protein